MEKISILFFTLVFIFVSGCQKAEDELPHPVQFNGDQKITSADLRNTVLSYYTGEDNSAWAVTYAIRSEEFKKIVPFETYEKEMKAGMDGWDLVEVEVLSETAPGENERVLQIRFHEKIGEKVAKNHFSNKMSAGEISVHTEETSWKYINNTWIAIQAGQRGHLPLNDQIVYD